MERSVGILPKTRYQGSKYKLIDVLHKTFDQLSFDTALDAFGGTASVSFLLKTMNKNVIYNDSLKFNSIIATGIVANMKDKVSEKEAKDLFVKMNGVSYKKTIESNFSEIYFLDEENAWLDVVVQNINKVSNKNKQAVMFWALIQSCLAKRPYNLFHRKNLHMRTANVKRSFGNKKTWDTSFSDHFIKFIKEANNALFSSDKTITVLNKDVLKISSFDLKNVDLVYLDSPYVPETGTITDYEGFYHFLEGIVSYENWESKIDHTSKHKKMIFEKSPWNDKKTIKEVFFKTLLKFIDKKIVISYRSDGIPSIKEIDAFLQEQGKKVRIIRVNYKYVLSKKKQNQEVIIIAE